MKLITPKSDHQQLELLRQILSEVTSPNSQVPQLPQDLYGDLLAMRDTYPQAYATLLHARENLHHHSRLCAQMTRNFKYALRDAFSQVKRKGRKVALPASIYQLFGLKADGSQPSEIRQLKAPIELAKSLLIAIKRAAFPMGMAFLIGMGLL